MMYMNCPLCGHKLLEGEAEGLVQVKCTKCAKVILAQFKDGAVTLSVKERVAKRQHTEQR